MFEFYRKTNYTCEELNKKFYQVFIIQISGDRLAIEHLKVFLNFQFLKFYNLSRAARGPHDPVFSDLSKCSNIYHICRWSYSMFLYYSYLELVLTPFFRTGGTFVQNLAD